MGDGSNVAFDLLRLSEPPSSNDYEEALRTVVTALPPCIGFDTESLLARIGVLIEAGRRDLGLARLLEGHLDAVSILQEAGHASEPDAIYAIWASGGSMDTTALRRNTAANSQSTLSGRKPFCSGAGIVDRALVWVGEDDVLVEVPLNDDRITWDRSQWQVDVMAGINTWTAAFDDLPIASTPRLQEPGWYFKRQGFWKGALCPAACWLGGALALVDYATARASPTPLAQRQVGLLTARAVSMVATLNVAASPRSQLPFVAEAAYPLALAARHTVESGCLETMQEFSRLFGPRPLVGEPSIARRIQELALYVRQCHGDKDLAELGAWRQTEQPSAGLGTPEQES